MRELLLMRHAKSDWGDSSLPDHARPLNARGRSAADQMAGWLFKQQLVPDRVLCSTSQRTRETLQRMNEVWEGCGLTGESTRYGTPGSERELTYSAELYHAPAETLLQRIRLDGKQSHCLMVLAHNPGMEDLVSWLAGTDLSFPTAAIGRFQWNSQQPWSELSDPRQLHLVEVLRPKSMRS